MKKRARNIGAAIAASCALAACASALGVEGDYTEGAGGGGNSVSSVSSISAASAGGGSTSETNTAAASSSVSASSAVGSGGAMTTSSSAVTSSAASSGSGGMLPVSWNRYSFDMTSNTWSTAPLSSVWTGANAPPTTGIIAATHLSHFDKLLVFADNGMFYLQDAGVWQAPVTTASRFPKIVNPAGLDTLYHVPSDWNNAVMQMPLVEGLNFLENPQVYAYNTYSDDTVSFVAQQTIMNDPPPPGPPQATGTALWSFEIWDKALVASGNGFTIWWGYTDGKVYRFGADFSWMSYAPAQAPIWAGKPGAPNWPTLQAAYFVGNPANGVGTIEFIGP